mgnify:CR=1 FL=1
MKVMKVLAVTAVVALGATGLFAADEKTKASSTMDTLARGTQELAEVLGRDIQELMRVAKTNFKQIKRATKGNYEAEQLVYQFGETMGNIDNRLQRINQQILPRMLDAVHNGCGGGGCNPGGGHGGGHGGGGSAQVTGEQVAKMLEKESTGSRRLEKLESYIKFTYFPNGGVGVRAILNAFEYGSKKVAATKIIVNAGRLSLLTQHVVMTLRDQSTASNRMEIAKLLARHIVDLNIMSVEEIANTFEYSSRRREITDYCTKILSGR